MNRSTVSVVVALAGRRIDRETEGRPRFPLAEVPRVRQRLHEVFRRLQAKALVSSAACGADLLGLDVAGEDGIARHIVLPFVPEMFRERSVVDRPGPWGPLFDRIVDEVRSERHLTIAGMDPRNPTSFTVVNGLLIDKALTIAKSKTRVWAVVVWDGFARDADDATQDFRTRAIRVGVPIEDVLTVESARGDGART